MMRRSSRPVWWCAAGLLLAGVAGCSGLLPKATPLPSFYTLDGAQAPSVASGPARADAPTLIVHPPHAAAGFDSPRIVYTREPHRLDYYAHSEWVDTPARMLTPLIVAAVVRSGALHAVVPTPSAAAADIGLDTELVRLQQDFSVTPSRVRLTLQVTLIDSATRRVLASREFDETVVSPSEDAQGGVTATHRAVQQVLEKLTLLCSDVAAGWRAPDDVRRSGPLGSAR
jgi:cholesterol transport system auxiliary component